WNTIKELQTANSTQAALNEHFKVVDQQLDKQAQSRDEERKEFQRHVEERRRASEDERKEIQRKLEELGQKVQTQAERLATLEGRRGSSASTAGKLNPLLPPRKTKPGTD